MGCSSGFTLHGCYHWFHFSFHSAETPVIAADRLFLGYRCKLVPVMSEVDRILRPEGKLIVRDDLETIAVIESMAKSMHWEIKLIYSQNKEGLLCVRKTMWRPTAVETIASAII